MSNKISEDDIRTKVIYPLLIEIGFVPDQILVEVGFEIKVGRGVFRIGSKNKPIDVLRPRADILVRDVEGKNLIVIEVKSPDEPLNNEVLAQGLSYARLLMVGGIAPFLILTNGIDTRIYDTLSELQLDSKRLLEVCPNARSNFALGLHEEMLMRSSALEKLICLSTKNLLMFCKEQTAFHMKLLKDDNIISGKKYIPSLYLERPEPHNNLARLMSSSKSSAIFIVGLPQVGKTNFVCHEVECLLTQGNLCLFYPAISLQEGLLSAICDDFQWIIQDKSSIKK